jgi:hypothetical protein
MAICSEAGPPGLSINSPLEVKRGGLKKKMKFASKHSSSRVNVASAELQQDPENESGELCSPLSSEKCAPVPAKRARVKTTSKACSTGKTSDVKRLLFDVARPLIVAGEPSVLDAPPSKECEDVDAMHVDEAGPLVAEVSSSPVLEDHKEAELEPMPKKQRLLRMFQNNAKQQPATKLPIDAEPADVAEGILIKGGEDKACEDETLPNKERADVLEESAPKELEAVVVNRQRLFNMFQSNAKKVVLEDHIEITDQVDVAGENLEEGRDSGSTKDVMLLEEENVEEPGEVETNSDTLLATKKATKALPPGVDSLPPGVLWSKASYTLTATRRSDKKSYQASVRKHGLQKALRLVTEFVERDLAVLAAAEKAARPSLWAARHKPQQLKWIKLRCWDELGRWLRSWSHAPPGKRAALVHGPVGVGKSTGAKLAAERSRGPGEKQGSKRVLEYDLKEREGRAFVENMAKGQATYGSLINTVVILEIDGACRSFISKDLRRVLKQSPVPIIVISSDSTLIEDESLAGVCLCIEVPQQPAEQVAENLQRIAESESLNAPRESWAILAEACGGDLRRAVNSMQLFGAPAKAGELLDTVATPHAACSRLLTLVGSEAAPLGMNARFELLSIDEELLTLMIQENYLRACAHGGSSNEHTDADDSLLNLEACAAAADTLAWGDILTTESLNCGGDVDFMSSAILLSAAVPSALVSQCKPCRSEKPEAPCRTMRCMPPSLQEGAHPLHWTAIGELSRQYSLPRLRVCGELLRWRKTAGKARDEAKKAPQQLATRLKRITGSLMFSSSRATERAILAVLPGRLADALDAALASGFFEEALAKIVAEKAHPQPACDQISANSGENSGENRADSRPTIPAHSHGQPDFQDQESTEKHVDVDHHPDIAIRPTSDETLYEDRQASDPPAEELHSMHVDMVDDKQVQELPEDAMETSPELGDSAALDSGFEPDHGIEANDDDRKAPALEEMMQVEADHEEVQAAELEDQADHEEVQAADIDQVMHDRIAKTVPGGSEPRLLDVSVRMDETCHEVLMPSIMRKQWH